MTSTPRERARTRTLQEITRIGREQLAIHGAAALSLRAVAREVGFGSSAVYRYVKNRDELLTLLVVDAYNELGKSVETSVDEVKADDYRAQFHAVGHAVRDWALCEPARYALLFGSPVPGYGAPADQTTSPGTRVITVLVGIYDRAFAAGAMNPSNGPQLTPSLAADFERIRADMRISATDLVISRGVFAWASMFGAINFEIFGQYGIDTFTESVDLFDHNLQILDRVLGFL
ncbi:TetR family transcriptional regulator (plasmid) [Rhodococcus erythropolis R138]|uniref:TetR/AcrR family transcriptional regulator n=1 Tax=Rhodococcus erythropolis TaxID=1833 RepID=UPI000492BFC3|nr:TetR/AcrR family transcriptional regulator [Rhodococcus erythropolis]ALU73332.1 TetR family transcriptional regulator [Rhodococcus erythropolis R138]